MAHTEIMEPKGPKAGKRKLSYILSTDDDLQAMEHREYRV
jgi:hypothetical protein